MTPRQTAGRDPAFVAALLDWNGAWFLARLLLVSAYLLGGVVKLTDFPSAIAEQVHFGVHPPVLWAVVTIAVELIGSAMILSGRWVWLGAGMLGVFTAAAAVVASPFWTLHGQERFMATNAFFEHLGLVGGFILTALVARARQAHG